MRNKQFPVSGDLESNLTTGQVSWAAVGPAGGHRPWSITKRIGRASGTGEDNCGKAALVQCKEAKAGRQDGSEAAVIREWLCLPF